MSDVMRDGVNDILFSSSPLDKVSPAPITASPSTLLGWQPAGFGSAYAYVDQGQKGIVVVANQSQSGQGSVVVQTNRSGGDNRRQFIRLGSPPGKISGSRILVSGGSQADLESERATGSAEGARGLPAKNKWAAPSSQVGQCGRRRLAYINNQVGPGVLPCK